MDEQKEKDGSLGGRGSEATVTGSEHVDGTIETPVEPMACEGQGQIGEPFSDGVVGEESGDSNGEDIMVEVLGSDVFVDGICTHEGEGRGGGHLNAEAGHNSEASLGGDGKSLDGGSGVADDLGSREIVVLGGAPSNLGSESGVGGSSVVVELLEEQNQVVAVKVGEEVLMEKRVEEKETLDDEAQNTGIGAGVEGSLVDVGSMVGETQVLVVEEVEMVVTEEGLEKGNVEESAERCREAVGSGGNVTVEAGVLDNESQNGMVENGAGCFSVVADSLGGETQPFVEEVAMESEEILETGLAKEGVEQGGELVGGHDAVDDMKTQKVGILDNEAFNPVIETEVVCSSAIAENLSVQTEVVEEKATVMVSEADLNVEDLACGSDPLEGIIYCSERDQISMVETVCEGTEKDDFANANTESLDQQTRVAVGGEIEVTDKEEFPCSKGEVEFIVMESGALDEDLSRSVEEQQTRAETMGGSTKNDGNVCMDSISSCQPNQVVGSEVAAKDNNCLSISKKDQQLELEECLDKSTARDQAPVHSNAGQDMEVDKQVTVAEQVSLCGGQVIKVEEQQVTVETVNGKTEGLGSECADLSSYCQSNQVVFGEIASPNDKVLLNSKVELTTSLDLDGMLPCSGETETVCRANVRDTQVSNRGEEIAFMDNEVLGPVENDQQLKLDECSDKSMACDPAQVDPNTAQEVEVDEQAIDTEQVGLHGGQEIEVEDQVTETEQLKTIEEKIVKHAAFNPGSSVTVRQASYQLPPENEGEFSVSDLVWGKVRSHPWWPGQIFDPSDSSEKAMRYYKKDCFLVAYFGDRTFAWNDSSLLKPFRMHFSQIEKQSNSETFQNAVDCALEEISRRVELGLACSCIPKDAIDEIKYQIVENTGIRQESSSRGGVDKSASANSFEPDKLVDYMKALAQFPSGGADRLELVIANAQLLSFYRLKGYCQLPEFQFCGGLLENDADTLSSGDNDVKILSGQEILKTQSGSTYKRKHNLRGGMDPQKKERSLSELMGGTMDSPDVQNGSDGKATSKLVLSSSGKKRRADDSFGDDSVMQDGRKSISFAKVTNTTPIHKQSFKIGECIRRVASQLTGSPSILKCDGERFQKLDGSSPAGDGVDVFFQDSEDAESGMMIVPTEYSTLDELLSQLHLAATDPMKGCNFLSIIISFFSDFRNSTLVGQYSAMDKVGGRRKKSSHSFIGSPETFEFEDMNDTYWTDMIIQNGSEEQTSRRKRKGEYQLVPVDAEKSPQVSRRSNSRKRYSDGNHELAADKLAWYMDEQKRGLYPAELIMSFPEVDYVPSEMILNKMFRRFGPLKESETEVDRVTSRARVVFRRCSDAEVAFSSAGKFNIFGPMLVNYQLSYSPATLFKVLPIGTIEGHEDAI